MKHTQLVKWCIQSNKFGDIKILHKCVSGHQLAPGCPEPNKVGPQMWNILKCWKNKEATDTESSKKRSTPSQSSHAEFCLYINLCILQHPLNCAWLCLLWMAPLPLFLQLYNEAVETCPQLHQYQCHLQSFLNCSSINIASALFRISCPLIIFPPYFLSLIPFGGTPPPYVTIFV